MKNFYHYLAENQREYSYRIKLAQPVSDANMDAIERVLHRYDVLEVGKPRKTIMQHNPMDFHGMGLIEVHILDVKTSRPAVSYQLALDIAAALKVGENRVVVRGSNEPIELQNRAMEELLGEEPQPALLGREEPAVEQSDSYGDGYNKRLLDYLAQSRANDAAADAHETTPKSNLFGWLNSKDAVESDDFNSQFDTVKPVAARNKKPTAKPKPATATAAPGNFDSTRKGGNS